MYQILLIDDDTETLQTIAEHYDWSKMGIGLMGTADNGISGLDAILEENPDIVLIDIKMPGMDGLTVIQEVQKHGCFPYFIVISGHSDFQYAQVALRLSVSDYLLKPYSPNELQKAFEKAVLELDQRIPNMIMPQYRFPQTGSEMLWYPVESETEIMNTIFTGKKQDLAPLMDNFILQVFSHNSTDNTLICVSMLSSAIIKPLIELRKSLSINPAEGIRWEEGDLAKSLRQFLLIISDETYSIIHAESTINPAVIAAQKFIRAHYQEKLTLDIVSENVYITPAYLSSLFSKTLGIPFVSYVNQVRIEWAQGLLQNSSVDPNTVAEKVGFSDVKYFAQVFKQNTGRTPTQYRNQMLRRDKDA